MVARIFILSPAFCGGERARLLIEPRSPFPLARRLHQQGGAPLGDVFAFLSGLYFRGKLAYARVFARPPDGIPGVLVITPGAGLVPEQTRMSVEDLQRFAGIPIDAADPRYVEPLLRDARLLKERVPDCELVLLGSVATAKYLEPLSSIWGHRLRFPADFVGRGDMSRGGLLLRCADEGRELSYVPLVGAIRRGPRPPRLPPRRMRAP